MIDHETLQDAVANRRAEALTFDGLEYARLLEPVNHYRADQ